MENAAKALTIAGGIFIALMILGALILMFTNLSSYQDTNDNLKKESQIADFNNQFTVYNKSNLTLMELKSLYNKIVSHNARNSEELIGTNILTIYPEITKDFKGLKEEDKQNARFECTKVEYGKEGKISYMQFRRT